MNKKVKILFGIWAVIVIAIIGALTFIGFKLSDRNEEYKDIEEEFREAAQDYVLNRGDYPAEGQELTLTKDELMKYGFLDYDDVENDKDVCEGYVVVKTDNIVKYKAYIKCNKYTTENYSE